MFKLFLYLGQGKEDLSVKEFTAQLAVEGLDVAVFSRPT